jgi:formiminotetrahydrofolate cyclodeaminase
MEKMMNSTLNDFCQSVGSDSFAPGGGCVAALAGALGASLSKMVLLLTIGKKKYLEFDGENKPLLEKMGALQSELMNCVDRDLEGCDVILAAMALPKESDADKAARKAALSQAGKKANEAPLRVCELAAEVLGITRKSLKKINQNTVTDWACGALQAYAALEGAAMNAKINCGSIQDPSYNQDLHTRLKKLLETGRDDLTEIRTVVHAGLELAA